MFTILHGHKRLIQLSIAASALSVGLIAGCASAQHPVASAGHTTPAVASAPTTAPAPTPSPNGTYQGACNYTLGSNPAGGTAVATGDVTVDNTGNIGTVDRVKITWPQQGYAPLKMVRVVHVHAGQTKDVQFHMPLSYDTLSNLQNWQTGHNFNDGCTYNVSMVDTFGAVQG